MEKRKSIVRTLAGMGLSATLFLGCQDFMGQKDTPTANPSVSGNSVPADVALRLAVKDSGACKDLQTQIKTLADSANGISDLEASFFANCVSEVRNPDSGKAPPPVPPALVPDDKTRCRWIEAQIDGGRDEMVIKFHYYCPDDCGRMEKSDTAAHDKYCRDPKPDCDELKKAVANISPDSEDFARMQHLIGDVCVERPAPTPVEDTCVMIRKMLASLDPTSDEYAVWKNNFALRCEDPKPVPAPPMTCDDMRKVLNATLPGTPDHVAMEHSIKDHCPVPNGDTLHPPVDTIRPPHDTVPPPPKPPTCDSLRLMLKNMDTASADYASIKHQLGERCPVPNPLPPPHDTLPPPPKPVSCDSLRMLLKNLDTTSADYASIKHQLGERCPVIPPPHDTLPPPPKDTVPVPPKPPVVNCDELRLKLANMDTTSADYLRLKGSFAEHCPVIAP